MDSAKALTSAINYTSARLLALTDAHKTELQRALDGHWRSDVFAARELVGAGYLSEVDRDPNAFRLTASGWNLCERYGLKRG